MAGLPALLLNLILSVQSDPSAESIAPALMPSSYAAAHAEPKEYRADRTRLLHTIASSGIGSPQGHTPYSSILRLLEFFRVGFPINITQWKMF